MTPDVPMIIPEINPEHINIISSQQKKRNWSSGFIAVKPNCSIQSYITPLYALHKKFKIKTVFVTTMQAVSGAGHPGVASLDILDNVIPYIKGEEEKTEQEPPKIWGYIDKPAEKILPNGKTEIVSLSELKINDVIMFVCGKEILKKKIKSAENFKTISALLKKYKPQQINPRIKIEKELRKMWYSFPNYRKKIRKHGLVVWKLK